MGVLKNSDSMGDVSHLKIFKPGISTVFVKLRQFLVMSIEQKKYKYKYISHR